MNTRIKDESGDRKYFVQTPMLVWALAQDPYDLTLWFTIKAIAGEAGECTLATEELATLSMMSAGKVSQCRSRLIELGLLLGELRKDPDYPQPVWHLTIPDVWETNVVWAKKHVSIKERIEHKSLQRSELKRERSAARSLHQVKDTPKEPSPGEEGVSPGEEGVSPGEEGVSPGETNKIIYRSYIDPDQDQLKIGVNDDDDRAIATLSSSRRRQPANRKTDSEEPPPLPPSPGVSVDPSQTLSMRNSSDPPRRRTRRGDAAYDAICAAIENNGFGLMTPILAGKVNTLMDAYPTDWIVRALEKAVSSNKLRLDYVEGILRNWQREGFDYDERHHHRERGGNGVSTGARADDAADRRQRDYNERYIRLLADEINQVISKEAAARGWEQLDAEFPDFEFREVS